MIPLSALIDKAFTASPIKSFAIALSFTFVFTKTAVLYDENFSVFYFAPTFYLNPAGEIFHQAFATSSVGWQSGRFISPIMHLLGGVGFAATFAISKALTINVIVIYGIIRTVMVASCIYFTHLLVREVLRLNKTQEVLANRISGIISVSTLPFLISNAASSSPRMAPLAYCIAYDIALLVAFFVLKVFIGNQAHGQQKKAVLASAIFLGIISGSTYEVTQVLAPISVIPILVHDISRKAGLKQNLNQLLKTLKKPVVFLYLLSWITPLLLIRSLSSPVCGANCYAPAAVNFSGFSISTWLDRAMSYVPVFSGALYKGGVPGSVQSEWGLGPIALIVASIVGVYVLVNALKTAIGTRHLAQVEVVNLRKSLQTITFVGLHIALVISFAAAVTVAFQTDSLPAGTSGRESLYGEGGVALTVAGIVASLVLATLVKFRKLSAIFLALLISSLIGLGTGQAFEWNLKTTRATQNVPGQFLNELMASEISNFDRTYQGEKRRCALVESLLTDYPSWEGHDRLVVHGLNLSSDINNGQPFCNTDEDTLFTENYGKKE